MGQPPRSLATFKVLAATLLVVSAGVVIAYVYYSSYLGQFTFNPSTTASDNTVVYHPGSGYSLLVTGDNCPVNNLLFPDNTLHATLNVTQHFFKKAFVKMEVFVVNESYNLNMLTPSY